MTRRASRGLSPRSCTAWLWRMPIRTDAEAFDWLRSPAWRFPQARDRRTRVNAKFRPKSGELLSTQPMHLGGGSRFIR